MSCHASGKSEMGDWIISSASSYSSWKTDIGACKAAINDTSFDLCTNL